MAPHWTPWQLMLICLHRRTDELIGRFKCMQNLHVALKQDCSCAVAYRWKSVSFFASCSLTCAVKGVTSNPDLETFFGVVSAIHETISRHMQAVSIRETLHNSADAACKEIATGELYANQGQVAARMEAA